MSEDPRGNIGSDSIEETRQKKMEEFRRTFDPSAIRGDYDDVPAGSAGSYAEGGSVTSYSTDGSSLKRKKKTNEINSYSDSDTKKRIERDSKKELKQQRKEEKKIEKLKAKRNRRIFKLVWLSMVIILGVMIAQYIMIGVNDVLAISRTDNPHTVTVSIPANPSIDDIANILKEKGVRNFGIHAFLASNTVTNEYYPMLAAQLFELVAEIHRTFDVHIAFVNLSGGVGVAYSPYDTPNDIAVIGAGVKEVYDAVLRDKGMGDVAIYCEMGRFMLAPYGALITKAIHEKHIYKEYIGVDACAANLMRPAMYGAYHHITVLGKEDALRDHMYDVTGSLCENNDKFAVDRLLPKIDMGDYLFIHDAGAHGFAMGYNYNGRLRSAELLLEEDGGVKEIRRAETEMDYFATFSNTEFYGSLQEEYKELRG